MPAFFLGAALLRRALGFEFAAESMPRIELFKSFVALDTTHTGFTFVLLALLPEGRRFVRDSVRPLRSWVVLALLLLLIFPLFLGAQRGMIAMDADWGAYALWAVLGLWLQHSIAQIFGMSLLYSRQSLDHARLEKSRRQSYEALLRQERAAFNLLIALAWVAPGIMVVRHDWQSNLFGAHLAVSGAVIGWVLLLGWRMHRLIASNKFAFLLRLGPGLFFRVDIVIAVGTVATHAFEYLLIVHKMFRRSSVSQTRRSFVIAGGFAFVAYPTVRYVLMNLPAPHTALMLLAMSAGRALDFLHFFVDGVIFRFKDRPARQHIAPLLRGLPVLPRELPAETPLAPVPFREATHLSAAHFL